MGHECSTHRSKSVTTLHSLLSQNIIINPIMKTISRTSFASLRLGTLLFGTHLPVSKGGPAVCCNASTVPCLACAEGMTEIDYCAQIPKPSICPSTPLLCSTVEHGDCEACLELGCGLAAGGMCIDSCNMIADVMCYEHETQNIKKSCTLYRTEEADAATCGAANLQ